jgi:hypothetical protein
MSLDVNPEMGPVHGQIGGTGRVLPMTTEQKASPLLRCTGDGTRYRTTYSSALEPSRVAIPHDPRQVDDPISATDLDHHLVLGEM